MEKKLRTINEARVLYSIINSPSLSLIERAIALNQHPDEIESIINYLISTGCFKKPPRFIKKTN